MKYLSYIFTILPIWIVAGYISFHVYDNPHLWGLAAFLPILACLFTAAISAIWEIWK